ncbi:hypothetical protein vseg_012472 [Gypsophila vaccaria]
MLLILLLLVSHSLLLSPSRSLAHPVDKAIFILAGQSNMAGRGGVINNVWDQLTPQASSPDPTILRLDANHRWHVAREPLHRGIDVNHTCGVGPAMAFANSIIQRHPRRVGVIGLVPCAVGGTNITQWARGGWLYGQMIRRTTAAVRDGGTVQGLVWYQGESDTVVKVDAERYQRRLEKLFLDIRTDLQSPMLPILQVAIASGEGPYIEEVRQAQMGVDLLNFKTIDAMGLPLEPDKLHLTTPAQVYLGEKLADAFLKFLPTQEEPNPTNMLIHTNNAPNVLHFFCSYATIIIALFFVFLH